MEGRGAALSAEGPGQCLKRRRLEHVSQRQVDSQSGTHSRNDSHSRERVSPKFEERVMQADMWDPQNLAPDTGQLPLELGLGRDEAVRRPVTVAVGWRQ